MRNKSQQKAEKISGKNSSKTRYNIANVMLLASRVFFLIDRLQLILHIAPLISLKAFFKETEYLPLPPNTQSSLISSTTLHKTRCAVDETEHIHPYRFLRNQATPVF